MTPFLLRDFMIYETIYTSINYIYICCICIVGPITVQINWVSLGQQLILYFWSKFSRLIKVLLISLIPKMPMTKYSTESLVVLLYNMRTNFKLSLHHESIPVVGIPNRISEITRIHGEQ
jgi:hypothetical protein